MNSNLQKQLLIGGLVGILILALTYILLGGKRDELQSLVMGNEALDKEVQKGYSLKANAEKLRAEIALQQKYLDALIQIMPTDTDRGEIPYRMKKLADNAGIDQVSFTVENPVRKEYYTEHPFTFAFRVGYHSFGQFASQVSGYDKIINVSELKFTREKSTRGTYPATVSCRVSAFVYNPEPLTPEPAPAKRKASSSKNAGE